MATNPVFAIPQAQREDPLLHLSTSKVLEYRRGQTIYNEDQASTNIYLVIEGKVKVARSAHDGRPVVVDIYQTDEFFGESAMLNLPTRNEQAVALENTKVMTWTTAEIEEMVARRPRLAIALLQIFAQRSIEFGCRIESFAVDNIIRRLAQTLIRLSDRLGQNTEDGSVHMMPLTHELLSQYVGTSREIVTHYMNQLRRRGLVRYTRRGIYLYRDALKDWFGQQVA